MTVPPTVRAPRARRPGATLPAARAAEAIASTATTACAGPDAAPVPNSVAAPLTTRAIEPARFVARAAGSIASTAAGTGAAPASSLAPSPSSVHVALRAILLLLAAFCLLAGPPAHAEDTPLRIGSKRFTESYILGELIAQSAAPHTRTEHKQGLGNTAIVLAALKSGSIDVYAEYTGTIDQEILKRSTPASIGQLNKELAPLGLGIDIPLGFNNTYALAVRNAPDAPRKLSDLAQRKEMRLGLSHEFIGRADGWPGLAAEYRLPHKPRGLDHGIAYEALAQKQVDVIDIYSTDAKISQYGLRVLDDDRNYFPRYDAVLLYRLDAAQRFPQAWHAIRQRLQNRISANDMIAMNAAAELQSQPFAAIARNWLTQHPVAAAAPGHTTAAPASGSDAASADAVARGTPDAASASVPPSMPEAGAAGPSKPTLSARIFADDLWPLTRQHLTLVALSVALACAAGVPLGILAAYNRVLRQPLMALVGMLQTVPSLALLAMLIPLLGTIGTVPALIALFVYALLPIVRNTATGIEGIPKGLKQAAEALGLKPAQRLLHIELPLAAPVILAGVKTAAVMSVGTATIAAFIGAGGYGERITTGLALNDHGLLLAGAIPAAVLALLTQAAFELLERATQLRGDKM